MPLPASGQIAFSQLAAELANACTNIGLRAYSACANLGSPDSIIELYGKKCAPLFSTGVWSTASTTGGGGPNCPTVTGTQNNVLLVGGGASPGGNWSDFPTDVATHYSNCVFSSGGALSSARHCVKATGTQNAGLAGPGATWSIYCAYDYEAQEYYEFVCIVSNGYVEKYNGTTWSGANNYPLSAYSVAGGVGTQNATMMVGTQLEQGCTYPDPVVRYTYNYNGANWSASGNLNSLKNCFVSVGTQNAAFAAGGASLGGLCNSTSNYNGVSWSVSGNLITAGFQHGGFGTQNAGVVAGANTGPTQTEEYNGVTWAAGPAGFSYPRAGAGTHDAGIMLNRNQVGLYNKQVIGKQFI